ncbi:MAG: efflux RND transporter permease subunit [Planctomycetes bacterium]|nr:efflux RND transporter permease subunit [Planctomycetota bacterium]
MFGYRLIDFFLRKPVSVLMLFLALLIVGLIAVSKIPVQQMPSGFEFPSVWISTSYVSQDAGISPLEVEENLVKPIEDELSTLSGLEKLHSTAESGSASFWVQFSQDTDMTEMYSEVKDRIDRVRAKSDDPISPPRLFMWNPQNRPIIDCIIMWKRDKVDDPYKYIDNVIMQRLSNISGVARTDIRGLVVNSIYVDLIPSSIEKYNLSTYRVNRALRQDNFMSDIGTIKVFDEKYFAVSDMTFSSVDEIRKFPITEDVMLDDIANITESSSLQDNIVRFNGDPAVVIRIYKTSQANTVDLSEKVKATLDELRSDRELEGFSYSITSDQGDDILSGINALKDTAIWGGIWAVCILFFFLRRFRMTMLIAMTIPLSVLIAIVVLYFTGGSINLLSLMGFTLAVGMLVDNAVVVTESIARYKEEKFEAKSAAILGAGEVMLAITLATLTTVIVFMPLILIGDNKGFTFYMGNIGIPLCLSLFASLLIAAVFIPPGASIVSKKTKNGNFAIMRHFDRFANSIVSWLRRRYLGGLNFVLKHRLLVFFVVAVVLYPTYMAVMPEESGGWSSEGEMKDYKLKMSDYGRGKASRIRIHIGMPQQSTLQETHEVFVKVIKIVEKNEKQIPYENILESFDQGGGRISLYLKQDADYDTMEITKMLRGKFPKIPGVQINIGWWGGGFNPESERVSILLTGRDSEKLIELANIVEERLKSLEDLSDITTEVTEGRDEMMLSVDRKMSMELNANPRFLMMSLSYALNGSRISDFREGSVRKQIIVRHERPKHMDVKTWKTKMYNMNRGDIFEMPVPTANNSVIPMKVILKPNPKFGKSLSSITRQDRKTTLQISANAPADKFLMINEQIKGLFEQFEFPSGYSWDLGERAHRWDEEQGSSFVALQAALIGVLLIMGFFFESLIMPFAVIMAVPLAAVGAFWMLIFTDTPLEMMGFTGFVILIGLVVNNGIVLIDLVNRKKNQGFSTFDAIMYAGKYRFRPIIMTSMTTIFGLLPMALGKVDFMGMNFSPLGKIVIGGLITSTLLMLFVVPVVYSAIDGFRKSIAKIGKVALSPFNNREE